MTLARASRPLLSSLVIAWTLVGCTVFQRADSDVAAEEEGDTSTGGERPDLFNGSCPVEPCTGGASATGGASSGGTSSGGADTGGASTGGTSTGGMSSGGTSTGGTSTGGNTAICGMRTTSDEIYLVIEEYRITGGGCGQTATYSFDTGVESFELNTTEGPGIEGSTSSSSFDHCDGGIDVSATIVSDGMAEVRRPVGPGVDFDGCTLEATVNLVSAAGCDFTVYPQIYPGADGTGLQTGTPVALTAGVPTDVTLSLSGLTTAGAAASFGVTFDRGENACL